MTKLYSDFISYQQEFYYKQEQIPVPFISSQSLKKTAFPSGML